MMSLLYEIFITLFFLWNIISIRKTQIEHDQVIGKLYVKIMRLEMESKKLIDASGNVIRVDEKNNLIIADE